VSRDQAQQPQPHRVTHRLKTRANSTASSADSGWRVTGEQQNITGSTSTGTSRCFDTSLS
jgi:hypothetical protein